MADEISQVVEVYISRETAQIDTASFNIPLLMVNLPDTVDNSDLGNPINVPADVTERVVQFNSAAAVGEKYGVGSVPHVMAQKLMGGQIRPAMFMVGVKNSSETYAQGYSEIKGYNDDWYIIAIDSKVDADIKEIAAAVQAERKLFGASSSHASILDAVAVDDIGSFLQASGYDRTFLVYHSLAETVFPEVAWIGGQISEVPGSNTWAFKGGAGVPVDRLNPTAISTLTKKNVNYYRRLGGVNMYQSGCTSQGEWIDVMIGIDWVQARIGEQIFYRLATKKKIPMTQAGAMIIEAEIRSVLSQGVGNGFIAEAPAYTVRSPDVLAIPEMQRGERIMGDFSFVFRLAGAVHKVIVRGVVGY